MTPEQIKEIRKKLTALYRNKQFNEVARLPKFELIGEKRDFAADEKDKHDCIWYVTQQVAIEIKGEFSFSRWQPPGYCQIKQVQPGDLLIYYASENGTSENHIGIYEGNGMVKSKFGYGDVYLHPLELIPYDFGPGVRALTKRRDKSLGDDTTLENMENWVKVYGGICSIKIDFAKQFPNERRQKINNLLKNNNNFLHQSGTAAFDADGMMTYSDTYRVLNDFLDNPKNRQALRDIYNGERSAFPQLTTLQQTQSSSSASADTNAVSNSPPDSGVTVRKSACNKKRKAEEKSDLLPDKVNKTSTAYSAYGLMPAPLPKTEVNSAGTKLLTKKEKTKIDNKTLQTMYKHLEKECESGGYLERLLATGYSPEEAVKILSRVKEQVHAEIVKQYPAMIKAELLKIIQEQETVEHPKKMPS